MKLSNIWLTLKEKKQTKSAFINSAVISINDNLETTKIFERLTESWQLKIFLASSFTYLFGEYNAGMGALLCLVVLDFLTKICALSQEAGGFGLAWKNDIINSRAMRKSLYKCLWYMALLIMSRQLELFTILGMNIGNTPVEITCAYLGLIEAKSILENLRDNGMTGLEPFISILGKKQEQLTGKKDKERQKRRSF